MGHDGIKEAAPVAGAWALWLASHALAWMPIVQFLSFLAAIAASIAATVYYVGRHAKS